MCCDGCNVWVHAECANFSTENFKVELNTMVILNCEAMIWQTLGAFWFLFLLQDMKEIDYFCPDCKAKSGYKYLVSDKSKSRSRYSGYDTHLVFIYLFLKDSKCTSKWLHQFLFCVDILKMCWQFLYFFARSVENNRETVLPDTVTVVCYGVEGTYYRSLHL